MENNITVEDVKEVAEDLDVFISTASAEEIVELYPLEAEANQGMSQDDVIILMLEDFED
jgi:hypothetical protein